MDHWLHFYYGDSYADESSSGVAMIGVDMSGDTAEEFGCLA
ncbi:MULTISPECIES: hypothetical protein [Paenibacillus]|nr:MULTISPECIES: hypothetical protein [Paenibacillus]